MTLADIAFIARTGTLEVASAAWKAVAVAVVLLAAAVLVAAIGLELRHGRPQAPAAEARGCPWCDDRVPGCDCTGDCGRPRCQAADIDVPGFLKDGARG